MSRQRVWTACLDSVSGQHVWTACLDSISGQHVWTACLDSMSGQSTHCKVSNIINEGLEGTILGL
jgi:hypothetical protein